MTAKEKERARQKVLYELNRGTIARKPCEVCGDPDTDAHHDDYRRQLDVRWLCKTHHVAIHFPSTAEATGPKRPKRVRVVPDPELVASLARTSADIRERQGHLRDLERERNEAIREAIAAGWTHQQIADATGLTRGRINQIKETP